MTTLTIVLATILTLYSLAAWTILGIQFLGMVKDNGGIDRADLIDPSFWGGVTAVILAPLALPFVLGVFIRWAAR